VDRDELLRLADQAAALALENEKTAAMLRRQEARFREMAEEVTRERVLHNRLQPSTVNGNMHSAQRLAISAGVSGDDAFLQTIRSAKPKGYTQNALATAIGVSDGLLSLYRHGKRKIPLKRAKRIEKLTGWPADAEHWPGGIVDIE